MKIKFFTVVFFCILISLYAVISDTGARARGLGDAFYAFSDDTSGIYYNPAFTTLVDTSQFAIDGSLLQFAQFQSAFKSIIKLKKFNLLGALYYSDQGFKEFAFFENGQKQGSMDRVFDSGAAAGTSFVIRDTVHLGGVLNFNITKLPDKVFFDSEINLGGGMVFDNFRTFDLITGIALKKLLMQNKTSHAMEKDFRGVLSARMHLKKLRTDLGLTFTYDIVKNYFRAGLGVEAFRDFIITPRLAVTAGSYEVTEGRGPVVTASGGLSAGLNLGNFHYKLIYAVDKAFTRYSSAGGFRHYVTFFMRRNLQENTRIGRARLMIDPELFRFSELYSVSRRRGQSKELEKESIDNVVKLGIRKIDSSSDSRYIENMLDFANQNLNNFLCTHPNLQKSAQGTLTLNPRLTTDGELMQLTFLVKNRRGKVLFEKQYTGPFTLPYEKLEKVERVRYVKVNGRLRLVPASSPPFVKKNNETMASFITNFKKDFYNFIETGYLKKLQVKSSQYDSRIFINDKYVGTYQEIPLTFLLKPGRYQVKAGHKGLTPVTADVNLNDNQELALNFKEKYFMVNLNTVLLTEGPEITASVSGQSKEFETSHTFPNISSTNRSLSLQGYYSIEKVPLTIAKAMDHNIFLLPDFRSSFDNTNIWQVRKLNNRYEVITDDDDVTIKGKGASGDSFIGVKTLPFFCGDFEISFTVEINEDGRFYFTIIDEDNRETAVVIRNNLISAQSTLEETDTDTDKKGLIDAYKLARNSASCLLQKEGDTIIVKSGKHLLYKGPFQGRGYMRMLIGSENRFEKNKVENVVENFEFNNL